MTLHLGPRTIVITGAGTGLGRETALALAESGYRVFGTARSASEVDAPRAASHGRAQLRVADITDVEHVAHGRAPAPLHTGVGEEADGIPHLVRNQSLAKLDRPRLRLAGLGPYGDPIQGRDSAGLEGGSLDLMREASLDAARSVSR